MEELLAQLLQQRALQTKVASDAEHGAVLLDLLAQASPERPRPAPRPGMPGNPFDPAQSHTKGRAPRVPQGRPTVTAGENANTMEGSFGGPMKEFVTTAEERNFRNEFAPRGPHVYRPPEPLDLVTDYSLNRDDDVMQTGWLPADFQGMSHAAAAALIADQLRTRRIRTMGIGDPEFQAQLPVF